jgi:hypothetical protein
MTISCLILFRVRNVPDKVVEKIKTQILCSVTFSENSTLYEIMSKNVVDQRGCNDSVAHARCMLGK